MKRTIFSIGLNVGDKEPPEQLARTLAAVTAMFPSFDLRIGASHWQGVPERFTQISVPGDKPMLRSPGWHAEYFARVLDQSAVAMWRDGCTHWSSVGPDGASTAGAPVSEFPALFDAPAAASRVNVPGAPDTIGHSSVQPWSAGEYFPAVIARIEEAGEYAGSLLTIGAFSETYSSREDAEKVARYVCAGGRIIPERYAELIADADATLPGRRAPLDCIALAPT